MSDVQGKVEPGFEAVRDAFARNFKENGEVGAAVCIHVNGKVVVDLWSGLADSTTGRPWEEDTMALVYSTTKGATAVCANLLVERGDLDLDAPVADYWSEFRANGKERIPVRMLLTHQAGLPVIPAGMTGEDLYDWDRTVDRLAAEAPIWEPGTAHGYHALTYGWLVGEVVRRISGESLGGFFRKNVAEPLGLDFWIGLPESEESRVSRLIPAEISPLPADVPEALVKMRQAFMDPTSLSGRALGIGMEKAIEFNSREAHTAEIPAANGITTARSLSKMYAALIGEVDGVRLLGQAAIDKAREIQSDGPDRVLFIPTRFGLGFMVHGTFLPILGEGSFGHPGAGGSVGFASPESGVAFGYVMNQMKMNLSGDPRTLGLIEALRTCL